MSRNRGIGIFTRAVMEHILRGWQHTDSGEKDEFFLIYDPSEADSTLKPILAEAPLDGCRVTWSPLPPSLQLAVAEPGMTVINGDFNAFLAGLRLDVLHLSSALEFDIRLPTHIVVCPYVVTLYDLIPLIYDRFFLPPSAPLRGRRYVERLGLVMRADHGIAISGCSQKDVETFLGVRPDKLSVAYPAADPVFIPRDSTYASVDLSPYGIIRPYVFSVTGSFTPNKSPELLIAAFAALPADLRTAHQLVLTVKLWPTMREQFMALAEKHGVAAQLVLTDELPLEVLLALYQQCSIYAHLSPYEGFGLPVLEAMHCGAPCVAANRASLPEVLGDAGLLVDPENAAECAQAFATLLSDPSRRARLSQRGLARAEQFTWQRTAEHYRAVYQQIGMQSNDPGELRVALWTPLRPTNTGIADYVEELLPYFAAWQRESHPMRVDIFTQSEPDNPFVRDNHAFFTPTAFEALHAWRPYDANIYQIGSTYAHHEFIYKQALKVPGIVVSHDPILHAYPATQVLGIGQREAYIERVIAEEGESLREFVRQALAEDAFWDALYHEYNMDKTLLRASRAVVYHSYYALRDAQQRLPNVSAFYIPLFSATPPDTFSAAECKRRVCERLCLPLETILVGTFGVMARKKRVDELIHAVSLLRRFYPQLALLIVGDVSSYNPVREAQRTGYSTERIFITGEVTMADFMTYLQAVDIGAVLRYPTLEETSAIISRLMGLGKPLIISDIPQFRELPDECCWKVPVNNSEVEVLALYLAELIENSELRAAMGYNALLYARTYMSPEYVTNLYRQVIDHEISGAPGPQAETHIPLRYRHQADLAVMMKQLRHHLRHDTAIAEP
ncbi:MAG TPA: glycosyltransferase [Anaerolineae bacterium]|nr:glycosyltransferase [Anaerolineae bacterium]